MPFIKFLFQALFVTLVLLASIGPSKSGLVADAAADETSAVSVASNPQPSSGSVGGATSAPQIDPARAPDLPPPPSLIDSVLGSLPMIVMITFFYYALVIRPQDKKIRSQQDLLGKLSKGDSVVTTGGIVGKVALIEDDTVTIESGAGGARIRILKSHLKEEYVRPSKSNNEKGTDGKAA